MDKALLDLKKLRVRPYLATWLSRIALVAAGVFFGAFGQALWTNGFPLIVPGQLLLHDSHVSQWQVGQAAIPSPTQEIIGSDPIPVPAKDVDKSVDNVIGSVAALTVLDSEIGDPAFDKNKILNDYDNRIDEAFRIPPGLEGQTAFWFDIYTKYDSSKKVIHHAGQPDLVFDVVDTSDILNQPGRRWMNVQKAEKIVRKRYKEIESILYKLSRTKNHAGLTGEHLRIAEILNGVKGTKSRVFLDAAKNLRIQTGQKDFFESGLIVSNRYLSGMEEVFRQHKLPTELARLPFVESSFNKRATSKSGAAGIWQFMPNTGRKFMHIDDNIDERRSPWKATEAAARLLKENHLILYRSWPLALTAYNHGPGGVRNAVKRTGTKDLGVIARTYRSKSFGFASANFYTEFLAALHAQKYHQEIWGSLPVEPVFELETLKLPRSMKPSQVIKVSGITGEDLILYNPDVKKAVQRNTLLPKGFRLFLPQDLKGNLERSLAQFERPPKPRSDG